MSKCETGKTGTSPACLNILFQVMMKKIRSTRFFHRMEILVLCSPTRMTAGFLHLRWMWTRSEKNVFCFLNISVSTYQ